MTAIQTGGGRMRSRIAFVLCAVFCAFSVPAFAETYMYFGGNYSNTVTTFDGTSPDHVVGGNISVIADRLYAALGFVADVSNGHDLKTDELKKIGVHGMETSFYYVPMRIGYTFMLGVGDTSYFMIVPALAFDLHFFHADFEQKIPAYGYVYRESYEMSGWGYSLGASLNLGMQHRMNKVYLRYGVDFDVRLLTLLLAGIEYSGVVNGTISDSAFDTVADYFMLTSSPYISIGFKL